LARAGIDIDMASVRAEAGHEETAIGRPHVARALIRAGYVADIESAFRTLLGTGKPGYVPSSYMLPHEAVRIVARCGGVAVLAHPGRLKDEAIIEELVNAGLAGLEVFYPTHDANQVAHYRKIAARYGLVMSAGSDFHDIRYNPRGVGMDVERADIAPFLDLVI
jgi:predicted metal-dependent phosphoesterase TrpH